MRNCLLIIALFVTVLPVKAQDEEEKERGFRKDKCFTGGNLNVSFFNSTTMLGVSPHFGYSLTNWIDIAAVANFNYVSQRNYAEVGDKVRQTTIGPGVFLRVFPVPFIFLQGQYEYNSIRLKYIPANNSYYQPSKTKYGVSSFLIGGGYTQGRYKGQNSYYFVSILFDVMKNTNSPYVDGSQNMIPIIRAGYNIALFQGNRRKRN